MHLSDRPDKLGTKGTLEEIAYCSGCNGSGSTHISRIGREDDDSRSRILPSNGFQGFKSCHSWHLQIHQGHIGTQSTKLLHSLSTIRCRTDEFHVALELQCEGDSIVNHRMVIGAQDPDFLFGGHQRENR